LTPTFDDRAEWFDAHYSATRGRVRLTLLLERLDATLPPPPARILDVGGGSGAVAVPLAERGYQVTLLEPSTGMLEIARRRIEGSAVEVRVEQAGIDEASTRTPGPFDAVCCHAVLLYLDDPSTHLRALRQITRDGGVLSLLEKNRLALAVRPGLRGDYAEAIRLLGDPVATGNLGIPNRSRSTEEWTELLGAAGWRVDSSAGIRLFSDLAPDELSPERFDELLTLEREAGRREPYRSVSRLLHLSATAG
jgi:SAM-dependent methyltransferase